MISISNLTGYHRAANALAHLGDFKAAMRVLDDAYRAGFRSKCNRAKDMNDKKK